MLDEVCVRDERRAKRSFEAVRSRMKFGNEGMQWRVKRE
jgi:hypothetical protein